MTAKDDTATPADTGARWRSRGPRKLPWIPIAAVSGLLVLVVAIVFRETFRWPSSPQEWLAAAAGVAFVFGWRTWRARRGDP